jgi:hypothetical protein
VLSINRFAYLALFALVSLGRSQPGQSPSVTSRPIFVGREPLSTMDKSALLSLLGARVGALSVNTPAAKLNVPPSLTAPFILPTPPVLLPSNFDGNIRQKYDEVNPLKSLLINDCDGFCNDPFFSFGRIVVQGAQSTEMLHPEQAPKKWYDSLTKVVLNHGDLVKPWSGSHSDQFQLLAVVNRLDFATPTKYGKWRGAELRFVYGAQMPKPDSEPDKFSVIVEFVLPDLSWKDFRTLAGAWHDLRGLQGAAFAARLKTMLGQTWSPLAYQPASCPLVRIRTNSLSGPPPSIWFLAQWELAGGKLQQALLTDEMFRQCTSSNGQNPYPPPCPQDKPISCSAYRPLYDQFAARPGLTLEVQSAELLVKTQCYSGIDPGMDGPSGVCASDPSAMPPNGLMFLARNILALQQCHNCHRAETNNTAFFQIANRMPTETKAKLSPFLDGNGHPKPSFAELNNPNSGAVFPVQVTVTWPGSRGKCEPTTVMEDRHFNDLARRSLYLAAVLVSDPNTPPPPLLTEIITGLGPDMTH